MSSFDVYITRVLVLSALIAVAIIGAQAFIAPEASTGAFDQAFGSAFNGGR